MIEYKRNPECPCSKFKDIDTLSFEERKEIKDYWSDGYIHKNGIAIECTCHRRYRLTSRYNSLAEEFGLPSYEELSQLKYLGEGDSYKKLKAVPEIVKAKNLKDFIVYVSGHEGNQKTTSAAKVIYNLITDGFHVEYVLFSDLITQMLNKDFDSSWYLDVEWLFIDDCFTGETVNFKSTYNAFYNLLKKRRKPTVLISPYEKDVLYSSKGQQFASYNLEALNSLFSKVDKYKSYLQFNDNVGKLLVTQNGDVDLWSM